MTTTILIVQNWDAPNLQIEETLIPRIIDGVDLLATDIGLSNTRRTFKEQHDIF